jgi:transcriptional regulator with XRE-family HTH domain
MTEAIFPTARSLPTMSATTSRNFDEFLARALQNRETREAFEDAVTRHRAIDALVRLRNRLGLTQSAVARHMGVKQPSVSGFETEGSDPRLSTLQRYARAVDASIWVQVIPDTAAGKKLDFYSELRGQLADHAQHTSSTRRAASWAGSRQRTYRHLYAVSDSVPA